MGSFYFWGIAGLNMKVFWPLEEEVKSAHFGC